MGVGHRARQALADPLLLGNVILPDASSLFRYSLHRICRRHTHEKPRSLGALSGVRQLNGAL
jgi:hypothetical protein